MIRPLILLLLSLLVASCSPGGESPITVSVIGETARPGNPNTKVLDAPARVMTGALMQGLVQYDARGEIEPALAERWMVTDDGLSYIFRVRRATWSDGTTVTAKDVAKSLRASLAPSSINPIKPLLSQVTEVVAMTDTVLEIRLREPQPGLLALLADPHMAITRNGRGTGPYRLFRSFPSARILRPVVPPTAGDISEEELNRNERRVRGESAPLAIARFAEGNAALVLGGSFVDLPLVKAANLSGRVLRIDPVAGVFGLVPARASGPISDRRVRQALAMSIDRAALVQRFGIAGWAARETLMPGPIDNFLEARPSWSSLLPADRIAEAARLIEDYGAPVQISITLPEGPGSRLLFAQLASDWQRIGVTAQRASSSGLADLRLVDRVTPTAGAIWYLRPYACGFALLCSQAVSNALSIARRATREERARLYSEADQAISRDQLFIPLAMPLRWSLVTPQLTGFAENASGHHPLNRLGNTAD